MMLRWLVLIATALLLPNSVDAQNAATPTARIEAARRRALEAGIPVALLESKIAEGMAKGIPLERIAEVVEKRQEALVRARDALARGARDVGPTEIAVGADALQAGVSEAVLQAVGESAVAERRAVAIAAITELVQLGQVPEEAFRRVRDALQRGPEALANLPAQARIARGRAESVGPAEANLGHGDQGSPLDLPAPTPGGKGKPSRGGKPGGSSKPRGDR